MASTPGSLLEIVQSVMIYILISTTTLFVLHAIKRAYDIISSPVFGSQRNFFHGNSFTYLQVCFFLLLFFVLLPIFFAFSSCFNCSQKFTPVRVWTRGVGWLWPWALVKQINLWLGVCLWAGMELTQTSIVAQSNIPGECRINRCECLTFFGGV